jgi:uncharacterized cupredoxin-like copper-binding protein
MRWLPALLALGALTLGGCGGGPSFVSRDDGVLRVTLDEYRLRPENLTVPAGRVRLIAVNRGRLTHNLAIQTWDPKPREEPTTYGRTDTLQPGASGRERSAITLKPGTYRLVCTISGHDDLGQYGELVVEKEGADK